MMNTSFLTNPRDLLSYYKIGKEAQDKPYSQKRGVVENCRQCGVDRGWRLCTAHYR